MPWDLTPHQAQVTLITHLTSYFCHDADVVGERERGGETAGRPQIPQTKPSDTTAVLGDK
jgi:hypothetical protein